MFRFHKTLDVLTLFHKPGLASSNRVLNILKQQSAIASSTATEDQASDHQHQNHSQRTEFELDVTEQPPTEDQLRNIFQYLPPGSRSASTIVKGAKDEADAMKKLSGESFIRPVVVDWNNGRAIVGDNESEIIKLLQALPKETNN